MIDRDLPKFIGPLKTTLIPPFEMEVLGYDSAMLSELVDHCVRRFHEETDPVLSPLERMRAMGACHG